MYMFYSNRMQINPDHVCWYDSMTLASAVKRSNFKVKDIYYHMGSRDKSSAKKLGLKFQPWMSKNLYMICERG